MLIALRVIATAAMGPWRLRTWPKPETDNAPAQRSSPHLLSQPLTP